jgi:hypothetical protein
MPKNRSITAARISASAFGAEGRRFKSCHPDQSDPATSCRIRSSRRSKRRSGGGFLRFVVDIG